MCIARMYDKQTINTGQDKNSKSDLKKTYMTIGSNQKK